MKTSNRHNRRSASASQRRRAGMTLMELMIVVAIMTILIGAALPLLKLGLEDRKVREASRQINTYFMLAKGRAAESGLPVAVSIEERRLTLLETPPPYMGDIMHAKATVFTNPNTGLNDRARFDVNSASMAVLPIRRGDFIQFDFKGPHYQITAVDYNSGVPPYTVAFEGGAPWPPAQSMSYQIVRQPQLSHLPPLELPNGIVIDPSYSGYGLTGTDFVANGNVIVFGPDGGVVRLGNPPDDPNIPNHLEPYYHFPPGILHLLVGRDEWRTEVTTPATLQYSAADPTSLSLVMPPNSTYPPLNRNIFDGSNLWVSINPHSGSVTTSENGWILSEADPVNQPGQYYFVNSLASAREFAQSAQTVGGR